MSDDLKNWLQVIGTGPNLINAVAQWKETIHEARRLLSIDTPSITDQPPVPAPHLEALIQTTHNDFCAAVTTEHARLHMLQQNLSSHVATLDTQQQRMQEHILQVEAIMEEYADLADQYSAFRAVVADDALPETAAVWLREDQLEGDPDGDVRDQMPALTLTIKADHSYHLSLTGKDAPMRAAAFARTVRKELADEWLPVYRQFAVADLRSRILQHVLMHFETTGVPPSRLTNEDAENLAEHTSLPDVSFDLERTIQESRRLLDATKRRFRKRNGEINWSEIYRTLNTQKDSPLRKRTDGENVTYQAFMQYKELYLHHAAEEKN